MYRLSKRYLTLLPGVYIMSFTLESIRALFPKTKRNQACSGPIPMDFFELNEKSLRKVMRENRLRAIYRGPRVSNSSRKSTPSMTCRCDATHVMLYRNNA